MNTPVYHALLAFVVLAVTERSSGQREDCEPLTVSICQGLGYDQVYAPGERGQVEAGLELHQFYPVMKLGCSEYMKEFVCSAYLPACSPATGTPVWPCRSMCREAMAGCNKILKRFGFRWPKKFSCRKFPTTNCRDIAPEEKEITTAKPTTLPMPTAREEDLSSISRCETMTMALCECLGYNFTHFPHSLAERQNETGLTAHQWFPVVQIACSPNTTELIRSLYVPNCTTELPSVPPCKAFCEWVKTACEPVLAMTSLIVNWPGSMACDRFPTENCGELPDASASPARPSATCGEINESSCHLLGYNSTNLPYSHTRTQGEIGRLIQLALPYVDAECLERIQEFVCYTYFPPCSSDKDRPCRSLCEELGTECDVSQIPGFQWSDEFNCNQFPEERCFSGNVNYSPSAPVASQQSSNDLHRLQRRLAWLVKSTLHLNSTAHTMKESLSKTLRFSTNRGIDPSVKTALTGLMHSVEGLRHNVDTMMTLLQLLEMVLQ